MEKKSLDTTQESQLAGAFNIEPPTDEQNRVLVKVHERFSQTARFLYNQTPKSMEQENGLRCLRESMFWFNEAVRKHGG